MIELKEVCEILNIDIEKISSNDRSELLELLKIYNDYSENLESYIYEHEDNLELVALAVKKMSNLLEEDK